MSADEVARVLRIIARHAHACADELSAEPDDEPPEPELSLEEQMAEAKRLHAERRTKK